MQYFTYIDGLFGLTTLPLQSHHAGGSECKLLVHSCQFWNEKADVGKKQVSCSPPTQIWYIIYEITLLSHPRWEIPSQRQGKGIKARHLASGAIMRIYLFGKCSEMEVLQLRQKVLSPRRSGDSRLGGPNILWTSNAAFCYPQTKLPWPAKGMGEGFVLSELKPVLTDMIRINFIALGILGESAWKKYPKFLSHFCCNKWI